MTYRPRKAPGRKVYHRSWKTGFLVNSKTGTKAAAKGKYAWIDNDHHLSSDGVWVNAHGAPEKTWKIKGKFESHTWRYLQTLKHEYAGRTFKLRSGGQALVDNAKAGLATEFEVKDLHPLSDKVIGAAFKRLARVAKKAYGTGWQDRVTVKVLTDLAGGQAYALRICRLAHAAGFKTMLLARGSARHKTFAGRAEVTYVRGSLLSWATTPTKPKPPTTRTPSPDKITKLALSQVGYHEGRSGSNWNNIQKYSPAVPSLEWSQGQAWCATFVSWLALKSGFAALFPCTASTDASARWWKAHGRWSEYPAIGAVGHLGDKNNDMFHEFYVRSYDATYIYTTEGNTNTNGSAQGDGVYNLKRRRDDPRIRGYGYPAYPEGIVSADPAWANRAPKK